MCVLSISLLYLVKRCRILLWLKWLPIHSSPSLPETEADAKASILYQTRIFEMVGYSISFASILASLCILSAFRCTA